MGMYGKTIKKNIVKGREFSVLKFGKSDYQLRTCDAYADNSPESIISRHRSRRTACKAHTSAVRKKKGR